VPAQNATHNQAGTSSGGTALAPTALAAKSNKFDTPIGNHAVFAAFLSRKFAQS
jgi:hypothetical protein